jgi:hypothetical protein
MIKVNFFSKNVYGKELFYFCNKEGLIEKTITNILNKKTITKEDMQLFEKLDICFEERLKTNKY